MRITTIGIAQGRAVKGECTGAGVIEIRTAIAALHGIAKDQRIAAGAADIGCGAIDGSCFQQQCWCAASGIDHHRRVKAHANQNGRTDTIHPVAAGRGNVGDQRRICVDRNGNGIGIALGTAGTGRALVAGDNL